ncbi:MAG TPA: glycosyltransferase family 2 protein [Candidatus Bathyarchaeia archaeon]|nr:glycosyltransferase family 2 protein [Candidatus Bathyarchaeia archaeon]
MSKKAALLSIVVPDYNEEHTIGDVIDRLKATLQKTGFAYEIIVLDDCSRDRSAEISLSKHATVYSLKQHMGKGFALRAGFRKAKGEIIVTIDSDGSNRPEELPLLLNPILQEEADLVIGSRFSGNMPTSGKRFNAAGVRIFNLMIRILTGAAVSDSQSGYRAMKSEVLANLRLRSGTYEIESEMLVKIARRGFRVREVPVSFEQRTYGKSTLDPIADGFKILVSIVMSYLKG